MTLLTEEEAKKRWCPFARYTLEQGGVTLPARNRWVADDTQLSPQPACCIASKCMAWRWHEYFGPGSKPAVPGKDRAGYRGFCGLAGRPE